MQIPPHHNKASTANGFVPQFVEKQEPNTREADRRQVGVETTQSALTKTKLRDTAVKEIPKKLSKTKPKCKTNMM